MEREFETRPRGPDLRTHANIIVGCSACAHAPRSKEGKARPEERGEKSQTKGVVRSRARGLIASLSAAELVWPAHRPEQDWCAIVIIGVGVPIRPLTQVCKSRSKKETLETKQTNKTYTELSKVIREIAGNCPAASMYTYAHSKQ